MSVQNITRRAGPYVGTGLVSAYTFAFKVFRSEDVKVVRSASSDASAQDETLKLGTDYTVKLNADQDEKAGGTVTLTSPLAEGLRLSILSAITPDQQMVLTNHDGFLPTTLNDSADKAIALIQELQEEVGRSLRVPASADKTPEDLTEELLAAQDDARQFADAAQKSAEEAKKSEEQTKAYAEAATVIVPFKDEIKTVADNIEPVVATGTAIEDVKTVAGIKDEVVDVAGIAVDVTTVSQKSDEVVTVANGMPHVKIVATDLVGKVVGDGDWDCGSTADELIGDIEVVDGNIHTVAINIEDVNKVADAIDRGDLETAVNAVETTTENVRLSQAAQKSAEAANASAIEAKAGADASNVLASKWATQTTAPVEGELYGAKYYAERAAQSESSTSGLLQEVMDATAAGVRNIQSVGSTQVTAVQNAGSTTIDQITQEGSSQKSVVAAEGTKQVGLVASAGTSNVSKVEQAGSTQVNAVNAAGSTQTANAKAQADAAAESAELAKSWATNTATTVDGAEFSAKYYATQSRVWARESSSSSATSTEQATLAKAWASKTGAAVDGGLYSALHYAMHAETQAGKAETAATTATNKATEAGTKASEAATSAQAAAQSAKVAAFAVRLTSTNMSANGTAALSTLTPSANVKVGDTVIDPDGEVFQIASIASSTFTVGARLANVRGPQGPKGETGAALAIKGSFPSLEELQEQHPTGTLGDAYMVGSRLYSWSGSAWVDCGDIKGPKGDQGIQGERGPTGPAGTTTWAGITGKPTLGALSAKDKITIADFDGDIDLGSTT